MKTDLERATAARNIAKDELDRARKRSLDTVAQRTALARAQERLDGYERK